MEALRNAQSKFGNVALSGEQYRWGMENFNLTAERIKELGATGILPPFSMKCDDHEGSGQVRFQQWDGTKWSMISDWIAPYHELTRGMILESAAKYAEEKGITPRSGDSMGSDCG